MIEIKRTRNSVNFYKDGQFFYDLTLGQIRLHGVNFWLNHLSLKNWFTHDVKVNFLRLINEHPRI